MTTQLAYFSRPGYNYFSGGIKAVSTGNTKKVFEYLQRTLKLEAFEIKGDHDYPEDYHRCTELAKRELNRDLRPALQGTVPGLEGCSLLILGYPCWWGTFPMPVATYLEQYVSKVPGIAIAPVCTHEGSGLGHSLSDIKRLCPQAKVLKGLALNGTRAQQGEFPGLDRFLADLNL